MSAYPNTSTTVEHLTDRAASKADEAIDSSKRAAQDALNSVQDGVDQLREAIPSAFTRAAAQVEALTRQGVERARQASAEVRGQVHQASDRTVQYIKDEPLKSVLVAAAAGAALVGLLSLFSRARTPRA
jgi:ElaB/YqjD/DUF883 family membrane-anchored ribosome-binding protein